MTQDPVREGQPPAASLEEFSIVQGGWLYRIQRSMGLAMPDLQRVLLRPVLMALITWLPLLILSAIQGLAVGHRVNVPFLRDYSAHIRLLVALPILVMAEVVIDPRLRHAVKYFVISGLVTPSELPAFKRLIQDTSRIRDSVWPSIFVFICAFAPSIWIEGSSFLETGSSTWHRIPSESGSVLSLAGWWFSIVSISFYRLWLFRWVWLMVLWTVFLHRVSRLKLRCIPVHPDHAAGLAFLTHTQRFFGLIGLSISIVLAAGFGNEILYQGADFLKLRFMIISSALFVICALAAPLLVVTPLLLNVKREGLRTYGTLGAAYAQTFDSKWIKGNAAEGVDILSFPDSSTLTDYCSDYAVVREMKTFLLDKETVIALALPAALPMVILTLAFSPTKDLLLSIVKLIL